MGVFLVVKVDGDGGVPDSLMNLNITRQMISNGNDDQPVKKKKRI